MCGGRSWLGGAYGWMDDDGWGEGGGGSSALRMPWARSSWDRESRGLVMRASKPAQAHGTPLYSLQTIHSIQPAALKE